MLVTHKRRQFLKEIFVGRKICSPSSNKVFIKISLPLEGIIGKIGKIKTMVLSKLIIGSHYKILGFT